MSEHDSLSGNSSDAPGAPVVLTRAGYEQLQRDVETLRDVQRAGLVNQIRRATLFMEPALGADVASVARYDLALLDEQLARLDDVLRRAQVVDPPADAGVAQLGSAVTVRYGDGTEETLTLVGPAEADPSRGLVSSTSPAGLALLGKTSGTDVSIGTGDDAVSLAVVAIGRPDSPVDAPPATDDV